MRTDVGAILALIVAPMMIGADSPPGNGSPDQIERGRYLVDFGQCNDCHTPKIFHADGTYDFDRSRLLSGHPADAGTPAPVPAASLSPKGWGGLFGNDFTTWVGPWGTSFTANLTPDDQTGLGMWTLSEFITTLTTGMHGADALYPPMPWCDIRELSRDDLVAIYAYLRSIPAVVNRVPDNVPGASGPPKAVCPSKQPQSSPR